MAVIEGVEELLTIADGAAAGEVFTTDSAGEVTAAVTGIGTGSREAVSLD